jgi:hypothetical protein
MIIFCTRATQWHTKQFHCQLSARKQIPMLKHALYSPDLSPCDFFLFLKLKKFLSKESIFSKLEAAIRKWHTYFKHFCRMTSGDALRPGRLVWVSV